MSDTKGHPECPVCKGDGYFFAPPLSQRGSERFMYCDCEKNIRDQKVAVRSDCFLHGAFEGIFCPTCEKEAGR